METSTHPLTVENLATMLKALAHPQRLRIFLKLVACCAPASCDADAASLRRCVGELGADLGLAASTVSHHLKELRQAGLMRITRRGQHIECWVAEEALGGLQAFFAAACARRCCAVDHPKSKEHPCQTKQPAADRGRARKAAAAGARPARAASRASGR
jgi:ArsR family transcriptional regulator